MFYLGRIYAMIVIVSLFFFKGFIEPKLKKVYIGLQNCSYNQFTTVSHQVLISK